MEEKHHSMDRRGFFRSAAMGSTGLLVGGSGTALGTVANTNLSLGIVGCGVRGGQVAENFIRHTRTQVTAIADVFEDRLRKTKTRLDRLQADQGRAKVSKVFQGLHAFQELVQSDVDVVLITSPSYFHPEHLEAALQEGKHVYLEKPVATDVAGCKRVAKLGESVRERVSVDVGFQLRSAPAFAELTRRLHQGAIGEITCVQGFYLAGDLPRKAKPGMSATEAQLRNWTFNRVLGGDILVEQNIHVLDIFNWVLQAHPLKATATGGRKARTDVGDVWDHYVATYHYPKGVHAGFMSTQFMPVWGEVCERFFGTKGFSEAFYFSGLRIKGENPWEAKTEGASGGKPEVEPLRRATSTKVKAFVKGISSGNYHNQLQQGVESCLTAILGRQAAYEGRELSWEELLASNQQWESSLDLSRLG